MRMGSWIVSAGFALMAAAAARAADGTVSVQMTNHRVVVAADGQESLVDGANAKPGEVIEYHAVYRNAGAQAAKNLLATVPVPIGGMEYLAQTAFPQGMQASLDGTHFETPPLRRTVTLADGSRAVREVPAGEYRFLRWSLGELRPGASLMVGARMRVVATTQAAGTREATKSTGMKEAK